MSRNRGVTSQVIDGFTDNTGATDARLRMKPSSDTLSPGQDNQLATTLTKSTTSPGMIRPKDDVVTVSRQFLSPDVGYSYHQHGHHHHHQHQGQGLGGHGGTGLERVPSVSRLQPQSSTETSGLGETVTSGFSSQESVHSAANYTLSPNRSSHNPSSPNPSNPPSPNPPSPEPGSHPPNSNVDDTFARYPGAGGSNPGHRDHAGNADNPSNGQSRQRRGLGGRSLSPHEARQLLGPRPHAISPPQPALNTTIRHARERAPGDGGQEWRGSTTTRDGPLTSLGSVAVVGQDGEREAGSDRDTRRGEHERRQIQGVRRESERGRAVKVVTHGGEEKARGTSEPSLREEIDRPTRREKVRAEAEREATDNTRQGHGAGNSNIYQPERQDVTSGARLRETRGVERKSDRSRHTESGRHHEAAVTSSQDSDAHATTRGTIREYTHGPKDTVQGRTSSSKDNAVRRGEKSSRDDYGPGRVPHRSHRERESVDVNYDPVGDYDNSALDSARQHGGDRQSVVTVRPQQQSDSPPSRTDRRHGKSLEKQTSRSYEESLERLRSRDEEKRLEKHRSLERKENLERHQSRDQEQSLKRNRSRDQEERSEKPKSRDQKNSLEKYRSRDQDERSERYRLRDQGNNLEKHRSRDRERSLEKQRSHDSGIVHTLDRPKDKALQRQVSRDSETDRDLEGRHVGRGVIGHRVRDVLPSDEPRGDRPRERQLPVHEVKGKQRDHSDQIASTRKDHAKQARVHHRESTEERQDFVDDRLSSRDQKISDGTRNLRSPEHTGRVTVGKATGSPARVTRSVEYEEDTSVAGRNYGQLERRNIDKHVIGSSARLRRERSESSVRDGATESGQIQVASWQSGNHREKRTERVNEQQSHAGRTSGSAGRDRHSGHAPATEGTGSPRGQSVKTKQTYSEGKRQIYSDGKQAHGDRKQVHSDGIQVHREGKQVHSDGKHQVHSDGKQVYSEGKRKTRSDGQQVHGEGKQPVYSEGKQPVYSEGKQPVYSEGKQPVYSEGKHKTHSDEKRTHSEGKQPVYSEGKHKTHSDEKRTHSEGKRYTQSEEKVDTTETFRPRTRKTESKEDRSARHKHVDKEIEEFHADDAKYRQEKFQTEAEDRQPQSYRGHKEDRAGEERREDLRETESRGRSVHVGDRKGRGHPEGESGSRGADSRRGGRQQKRESGEEIELQTRLDARRLPQAGVTSSPKLGSSHMGSDGRRPPRHPPPPVTVTSPTSPTSPDSNLRPHPNGDVGRRRHNDRATSGRHHHPADDDDVFDNLFTQASSGRGRGPGPGPGGGGVGSGLQVEQINQEWERRGSRGSLRSRSSHGSFRSHSGSTRRKSRGRFLGVSTESAWTRWSRDRRASFRRRIELLDNPEENLARVSTPVRKARQEGLKFVHPDLEGKLLSEEDLNELRRHKQQKYHAIRVIEKNRKGKFGMKSEVHLTQEQWQLIGDFWEHPAFVRGRYLGLLLMLVTFIVMVVSITDGNWITYEAWNLTVYEGLWVNCSTPILIPGPEVCRATDGRGFSGGIWHNCYQNLSDPQAAAKCPEKRPHWQNAVIGLMIFAASFGLLASVLSICGVCTSPLPRKIYYFHSAGEIFLICALSTGVALMVYPIAIELDKNISSHRYGIGYGLGWGGAFFFLAAALCMSLDDLVREASRAKCCRWCWKSKQNDRTELRQV